MTMHPPENGQGGSVPVPDPTKLTTDIVNAAKADMRRESLALRELIESRLHAMDTATQLQALGLVDVKGDIIEHSEFSRQLAQEKLFALRELWQSEHLSLLRLVDERALAAKEALAAALQAAKELVTQQNDANAKAADKSELSFTKQIDQIAVIIKTSADAQDARMVEIKERIDRGEGVGQGTSNASGIWRSMVMGVIAIVVSIILGITVLLVDRPATVPPDQTNVDIPSATVPATTPTTVP